MILTDSKKSQAQTVIGLDSVAGVSVTGFKDGLFSLHLSEVSELGGGRASDRRRWWAAQGWSMLEVMGRPGLLFCAFDVTQPVPEDRK